MKTTIGLIFLFAVINVSFSTSIRELDFTESLYPSGNVPDTLVASMVNRRINQIRTDIDGKDLLKGAKNFYNIALEALESLLKSMNANDTQDDILFKSYAQKTVIITQFNDAMKFQNDDYLAVDSSSNFTRDELADMMNAYIGDIEMVRMCEVSLGRADRVDMKIVESIKSLSSELRNHHFDSDDAHVSDSGSIARKTMDQYLSQFKSLLSEFTETFISYKH